MTQTTLGIQDTGRRQTATPVTQTSLGIQDTGRRKTANPVTQTTLGIQDKRVTHTRHGTKTNGQRPTQ